MEFEADHNLSTNAAREVYQVHLEWPTECLIFFYWFFLNHGIWGRAQSVRRCSHPDLGSGRGGSRMTSWVTCWSSWTGRLAAWQRVTACTHVACATTSSCCPRGACPTSWPPTRCPRMRSSTTSWCVAERRTRSVLKRCPSPIIWYVGVCVSFQKMDWDDTRNVICTVCPKFVIILIIIKVLVCTCTHTYTHRHLFSWAYLLYKT